jgi:hypothetical protein
MDEVGSGTKGSEAEAAPASLLVVGANDLSRINEVVVGTGANVGGMDAVDIISIISSGEASSRCVLPSRGWDNVATVEIPCSATASAPGGDVSVLV